MIVPSGRLREKVHKQRKHCGARAINLLSNAVRDSGRGINIAKVVATIGDNLVITKVVDAEFFCSFERRHTTAPVWKTFVLHRVLEHCHLDLF